MSTLTNITRVARLASPSPKTNLELFVNGNSSSELPEHDPGLVRDLVEKTGGVLGAVSRIPTSLVSGALIGGHHGRKRGLNAEYETKPLTAAAGIVACNAAQNILIGASAALLVMGPAAAAVSVIKDAGFTAADAYMFVKGGSAGEMGERLASDIDHAVNPGQGGKKGLVKGAWAGAKSAVRSGATTGFHEGQAAASGLIEGTSALKSEVQRAEKPKGGLLRRVATRVAGTVAAALSTPAGLAFALLADKKDSSKAPTLTKRLAIAGANGALAGGASGLLIGGPVGAAIGAGIGAILGVASPVARKEFAQGVQESLKQARADDTNLGHPIANQRRDLVQSAVVGVVAGGREGWDSVVEQVNPDKQA